VGLKKYEIPTWWRPRAAKKMVKAYLEDFGSRRVARDMSTEFAVGLVGAHNHGKRIPANDGRKTFLECHISRMGTLSIHRNSISVG
jgi:hypothetical protein